MSKKKVKLKNIPSRFAYAFSSWPPGESPGEGIVLAACVYDLSILGPSQVLPSTKSFPVPKPAASPYEPVAEAVIGA